MFILRCHRFLAALAAALLACGALAAATVPKVTFTDTRLKNGLRVIIAEDHTAPVFSIAVNYNVGSRDERKGRTGFAHLFEHMMFKGSTNVGPGEHFLLIFNNGGNMNGTTNKDRTLYFETLPNNQLDLALFLEADRMRSLDITKENLDNQRNAVQEERRLGVDNQPYGKTTEVLEELAYDNVAYEHSVIGSMEDLNAASIEDVASFFKNVLRTQQCGAGYRWRCQPDRRAGQSAKAFRIDFLTATAAGGRSDGARAEAGATDDIGRRACAVAASGHGVQSTAE